MKNSYTKKQLLKFINTINSETIQHYNQYCDYSIGIVDCLSILCEQLGIEYHLNEQGTRLVITEEPDDEE